MKSFSEEIAKSILMLFHSMTKDKKKKNVLDILTSTENTSLKLVIATSSIGSTSSIGCGVNIKNVDCVIYFGPADTNDLVDYCQQIGRTGRDILKPCVAPFYIIIPMVKLKFLKI